MNYRDFFKKNDKKIILPEGVNKETLKRAIQLESKATDDLGIAAKIALKNLQEDSKYYARIYENDDCCGEEQIDDNGGIPKLGGALAVKHVGQPINISKIVQSTGFSTGISASGEVSGMTNVGGYDKGVPVKPEGNQAPLTAGGKKVDGFIASKSVGGDVVPGEGQIQCGNNHGGTIEKTPILSESAKKKIKKMVREVLFEMNDSFNPGDKVKISAGSGIDSGKVVTVIDKSEIQTDGRGVPINVSGAYKPVDWNKEVAFRYDDGRIGLISKNRLTKVTGQSLQEKESKTAKQIKKSKEGKKTVKKDQFSRKDPQKKTAKSGLKKYKP